MKQKTHNRNAPEVNGNTHSISSNRTINTKAITPSDTSINFTIQKQQNETQQPSFTAPENGIHFNIQKKEKKTGLPVQLKTPLSSSQVAQLLPKFKNEEEAIVYFEDTLLDDLEAHAEDVMKLKHMAIAKEWDDLLERINHYTAKPELKPKPEPKPESQSAIRKQIETLNLSDPKNLPEMKTLLDIIQKNHWDDLEALLIIAVRKLEDASDPKASITEESNFYSVDDLPGIIHSETGIPMASVKMAVDGIFWGTYGAFDDKDVEMITRQVRAAIKLNDRVQSVLTRGILKPTDLEKSKVDYTPSSDGSAQDKISLFDVQKGRNKGGYGERFPFPGHQSIGPVLERRNDINNIIGPTYRAAKKGNEKALAEYEEFRAEFAAKFGTIAKAQADNIDKMDEIMKSESFGGRPLISSFMAMLVRKPQYKNLLEGRASRSAMFISTGPKLASSSLVNDREKKGPDVQEMRIGKSLEAEAISHVLLPEYMRGFLPSLKKFKPGISFSLVGTTNEIDVGYYNEQLRTSTSVKIKVPDYQSAIDSLIKKGNTEMLTHISNID